MNDIINFETKMKILHITEDHSLQNFGITSVVSQLTDELSYRNSQIQISIASSSAESVIVHPRIKVTKIPPNKIGRVWRWTSALNRIIEDIILKNDIELIHIHGIWMAIQFSAAKIAKRRKIPTIISTHGMLESWFWEKAGLFQRIKKLLYYLLFLKNTIDINTNLHAITLNEKHSLQKWFPETPKFIIPNAISVETNSVQTQYLEKYFLFLGRLNPIKGLDNLICSFGKANLGGDWKLLIAGPKTNNEYVKHLEELISKFSASSRIKLMGPVYGDKKNELIKKAWALILPSYSEVMGMVNLEAANFFVPSITTFESGLYDWDEGGGVLIHPNESELITAIQESSSWDFDERIKRGKKSYEHVKQNYSWDVIVPRWEEIYKALLKNK